MINEVWDKALERVAQWLPDSPLLPRLRQQGQTPLNQLRMVKLLAECAEMEARPVVDVEQMETPQVDPSDHVMRGLQIEKSNLFVKRAKLSNLLHECQTDKERSNVVDSILEVQREIETMFQKIRHYQTTGTLPEEDEYRIPTDGADLVRLQSSLRVQVSQVKKEIETLYQEERTPQVALRLTKLDERLKNKETHLKHVTKEIDNRKPARVHE